MHHRFDEITYHLSGLRSLLCHIWLNHARLGFSNMGAARPVVLAGLDASAAG
jgi:hypothetical protein